MQNVTPFWEAIIFYGLILLFILSLMPLASKYISSKKWKIFFLYCIPIIVIVFSLNSFYVKSKVKFTPTSKLKEIYRQDYRNEVVVLDGRKYVESNFNNVNFSWEGDSFEVIKCKKEGELVLTSKNRIIKSTFSLLKSLNVTKENFKCQERSNNVNR